MSASIIDPWCNNPPKNLIRHECGHAYSMIEFGAVEVAIYHDGHSWRSDPNWGDTQPDERAVAAGWLGALAVPEYMSAEDEIVCRTIPLKMEFEILTELDSVFDYVRSMTDEQIQNLIDGAKNGIITIQSREL
jgi:hypothetical protein